MSTDEKLKEDSSVGNSEEKNNEDLERNNSCASPQEKCDDTVQQINTDKKLEDVSVSEKPVEQCTSNNRDEHIEDETSELLVNSGNANSQQQGADKKSQAGTDEKSQEQGTAEKLQDQGTDEKSQEQGTDEKSQEQGTDEKSKVLDKKTVESPNILEQNTDEKSEETSTDEKSSEEFLDILGNGTLLKKVLEAGSGSRPQMGDEVVLHLLTEIPEIDKVLPEEQLQFVVGDGDVVQALDLAVALMDVGEKATVLSGYKYMYGELGLKPDIPPKSNFKLTVSLITNNGPLDFPNMDFTTRFELAKKKKERGNFLVKRKEYFPALNSYTKASRIVDPTLGCVFNDEPAEKLQQLLEFRAIVLCNASLANFKLESYDAAVKVAEEACSLWPSYSKAYWRLAQAQEKLGMLEETVRNYKLALKYDPNNSKYFHGELERLTKLLKKNKQAEKEMYSKMFWGSNPPTMDKPIAKPKVESLSSWLLKTGGTVIGAGLVALAGIGVYKYLNH